MKYTVIKCLFLCLLLMGCAKIGENTYVPQEAAKETVPTTDILDYLPQTMPDYVCETEQPENGYNGTSPSQNSNISSMPSEAPVDPEEDDYTRDGLGIELPDVNWN